MGKPTRIKGKIVGVLPNDFYNILLTNEVDKLNTKQTQEARDNYEKVFITIRQLLENNEQYCCDDETDRLSLCQDISDILRKSSLIRKEER